MGTRPICDDVGEDQASSLSPRREVAKYGEECSLSKIVVVNVAYSKDRITLPQPTFSVAAVALRIAHEEVERIIRERHAAVGKPLP